MSIRFPSPALPRNGATPFAVGLTMIYVFEIIHSCVAGVLHVHTTSKMWKRHAWHFRKERIGTSSHCTRSYRLLLTGSLILEVMYRLAPIGSSHHLHNYFLNRHGLSGRKAEDQTWHAENQRGCCFYYYLVAIVCWEATRVLKILGFLHLVVGG